MVKFYEIAHGEKLLETSGNFPWPYDISICFDGVQNPIGFGEGVAHGSGWCAVSAKEALEEKWAHFFVHTHAEWLLEHIANIANGGCLSKELVLNKFIEVHGHEPKSFEANVT